MLAKIVLFTVVFVVVLLARRTSADQALVDAMKNSSYQYVSDVRQVLRKSGYRILDLQNSLVSQLVDVVEATGILGNIEEYFLTADDFTEQLQKFIDKEAAHAEREVRKVREQGRVRQLRILGDLAELPQIKQDLAEIEPVFEQAVKDSHFVISEKRVRYDDIHELAMAKLRFLNLKAQIDTQNLQQYEADLRTAEKVAVTARLNLFNGAGQKILRIFEDYIQDNYRCNPILSDVLKL